MRNKMRWIIPLAALLGATLCAQDISGDWQGTLKTGAAQLRVVLHIVKDAGGWKGTLFSIDQGTDGIAASSVTLEGSNIKLTVDAIRGAYEGKVSADGASMDGTWTQGMSFPLELKRATKETAWQRDPTPHTVQFVTVDN